MTATPSKAPAVTGRNAWRDAVWASDLPPLQRLAALCFADHAADNGRDVWVTTVRGVERTGMGEASWHRARRALEAAGWLRLVLAATPTTAPRYRLTIPQGCDQSDHRSDGGCDQRDHRGVITEAPGCDQSDHQTPAGTPTGTPTPSAAAVAAESDEDTKLLDADSTEWADRLAATDPTGWDTALATLAATLQADQLDAYCDDTTDPHTWWRLHEQVCDQALAAYDAAA